MSTDSEAPIPPAVKVAETCRCGAQITVEGFGRKATRRYVDQWRGEHRHDGLTRQPPGFVPPPPAPLPFVVNGESVIR